MCWHAALPARPQRQREGQCGGGSQYIYSCINARVEQHINTADFMFLRWKKNSPGIFLWFTSVNTDAVFILLANQPSNVSRQVPINTGIYIIQTVDDTQTPNTNEGKSRNRGGNGWEVWIVFEEYYFLTEEGQHWSQVCGLWIQQPLMYFFNSFSPLIWIYMNGKGPMWDQSCPSLTTKTVFWE